MRGWKRHGLRTDGDNRLSATDLLRFCETHASLRAAEDALPRLRNLCRSGVPSQPGQAGAEPSDPGWAGPQEAAVPAPGARGAVRSARAAASEHLLALLAAARAAETVATRHREQLEHLMAAYQLLDDALVDLTGPHDLRG